MADLDYFPENYADARRRFLKLRDAVTGPKISSTWAVPSAQDEDLAVDTLYLPALSQKKILFVVISGVHGLEAYAGHGIQAMVIQDLVPKLNRDHAGLFFIHSLNPYGFKHHRRNTEGGVNLNRNCSAHASLYKTKNEKSVALSDRFIPKTPVGAGRCFLLERMRDVEGKIFLDDVALDDFIKDTGLGQYQDPAGLEFGGFGPEPQIAAMTEALREFVPQYDDIVLLDLHTGLGERARLHLLTGDVPGCVDPDLFGQIFHPTEDHDVYDFTPADSEGFYQTYGATNNIFPELALPRQRVCAMTMEFGTLGHSLEAQMKSLDQWLLEHQGNIYGFETPEIAAKVRADYLEKFFPADPRWRAQVLKTSRELFTRVFARSGLLL